MTKGRIITSFLINSELASEYDKGPFINVKYDGTSYRIPKSDLANYEALHDMLPDWRDDLPKQQCLDCFVLRKSKGRVFLDTATWYSKCADMPLPNAWCGKGFYKNINGKMMSVPVQGWALKENI